MVRVRWRWSLPLGHAVIDCIALIALITYSHRVFRSEVGGHGFVRPALLLQESGSIEWDPRTLPPPGPVLIITTGALPSGLIAGTLRPNAAYIGRRPLWDPIWLLLHEALSFPCWFLLGVWSDTRRGLLIKVMIGYLAARLLFVVTGSYDVGWRFQILFWMGMVLCLFGLGIAHQIRVGQRAARRG
jgi:hypothetical protein